MSLPGPQRVQEFLITQDDMGFYQKWSVVLKAAKGNQSTLGYAQALLVCPLIYIVVCQRGGFSNKLPWLQAATRHGPGIL